MIVVGIDPGLTGALSFIDTATGAVAIEDLPMKARTLAGRVTKRVDGLALATLIRRHVPAGRVAAAVCENVTFYKNDKASPDSVEGLIGCKHAVLTTMDVLRISSSVVEPKAWQGMFNLAGKSKEPREKGALPAAVLKARELYPAAAPMLGRVKDHNRAESLLIAHFAVRTLT